MNIRHMLLVPVIALSACSAPPPQAVQQPASAPPPKVVTSVQTSQEPAGEWTDWQLALGDWVYRRDERGSIALFGPIGGNALVTIRCDTARRKIYLAREGQSVGMIVVRSSSAMKELTGAPTGGVPPYIAAEIAPNDPILDAMALSRGRIAINVAGQQPLAIPSWAEITRVVEDCRG